MFRQRQFALRGETARTATCHAVEDNCNRNPHGPLSTALSVEDPRPIVVSGTLEYRRNSQSSVQHPGDCVVSGGNSQHARNIHNSINVSHSSLHTRLKAAAQPHGSPLATFQSTGEPCVPESIAVSGQRPVSPGASIASTVTQCSSPLATGNTSFHPAVSTRDRRTKFFIFVKILLQCLVQANEMELQDKLKKIVRDCTRRNRMGDPHFVPLMQAVDKRLRPVVGERYWRQASVLLGCFLARQQQVATADKSCPIPHEVSGHQDQS